MAGFALAGDTSGQLVVNAPAVAGSNTLTLQAATATNSVNTLGTAVASTSGTSIDFTGLPSWVKRITVMFSGVSTNGTNPLLIQGGNSGGVISTGYNSTSNHFNQTAGSGGSSSTSGFIFFSNGAGLAHSGIVTLVNLSGSTWISSHTGKSSTALVVAGGGDGSISTLDRIRITTTTAVDAFDAGTINILYEG
jgi:hypothetical protein